MRLLIINNEFPPLGGGQGVVNQILLREWRDRSDLTIDAVVGSVDGPEVERPYPNVTIHRVKLFNKNIHHSSNGDLLRFLYRASLKSYGLASENKYDLCLAFSAVPAGAIAFGLKRRFGIPYMTRSPGVDIPGFEARYRFLYPVLSPIIRAIWKSAQLNFASSSQHLELMKQVEPHARYQMIPNGIDRGVFNPGESPQNKVVILSVARLVKRKGIDLLLQAFKNVSRDFPEVTLKLVGTGDDQEQLRRLASDLGIAAQVEFAGAIERSHMPEVYRSAGIFVLPSWNEGMSNAGLEALASGLPMVMSDVGGATELIEDGTNGFKFTAGSVVELERCVRAVLADSSLRLRMSEASRKRSEAFEWGSIADRYLKSLTLPLAAR